MYTKCVIAFLNLFIVVRAFTAEGCAPCDLRTCAEETAFACDGGRTLAKDPCGCCDQCTRLQWEPCGGQDWTLGYCALGLTCAAMNQTGAVTIPDIGVCKVLPEHPEAGLEDLRCPLLTGCDRAGAQCVCDSRHSCLGSFSYPDRESCMRSSQTEGRRHSGPPRDRPQEKFVGRPETPCRWAGCNLTARGCVCEMHSCHRTFAYADLRQCRQAAEELRCAAVTCPSVPVPSCPPGSVLTKSYTPPAGCCPSVPARCTCDPASCPEPRCPSGLHPVLQRNASGAPGDCCPLLDCQKGSPKCVHNGKEFSESEVYRMDHCWLCQCRGGISFCSKAECAELDCDNFYVPDGECCPVCLDVVLLSSDGAEASCWMSNALRAHEEQWREDDCTFCQCVDGDPRCTAMACRQSCQNPVKIPGECCPFCKEPSYETLSPVLCPRLENCTLSGTDCPLGFQQDHDGCLLCACLNNDSCPDLGARCSLQCPMGYEKDAAGCDACECAAPTPKCRPLTCSKSCPHGYVRNKHGCEMCRCVKCPPFTCDKHCHHGYRHNKKGCSVCMCKESASVPSTSPPAPAPSHCLTSDGRGYEQGESWHDGCRDCYCHSTQREMCVLISCPVPSCPHPVVRPQQCCPTCEADESGSGQPEGGDLVVCRALGGELYVEGDTWNLDECTRCTCRKARVLCDTEICPPAVCPAPVRNRDTCCYVCPENQPGPLLPVDRAQQDYCVTGEGEVLLSGDTWRTDACTSCLCANGTVQCFSQRCPPAVCRVPVLRKGQCCPHCLDTSTTSAPVTVTTSRATFRTSPRTTTTTRTTTTRTTSTRTPTRDSPVWVTTAAGPPVVIIPATDDSRLGEDYPSQTEMALIYQSAAWILAGLLLAIVIFLVVALLVNRKKKWVQMSCYSAPKKTVILKKHLNKNSVVYMEPTKESKFQGGLVSFSPETGLRGGGGERMILPRAKLSTGSGRGPR